MWNSAACARLRSCLRPGTERFVQRDQTYGRPGALQHDKASRKRVQSNVREHGSADCIHKVIGYAFRIEPVKLMSNVRDEDEKCSNERNSLDEGT